MNKFKKILLPFTCILLLFFAFSIFFRSDASFDQDLGRHIKLGEIAVKSLSSPNTNLFSYTYPDFPFINHHFLFGVILYIYELFFPLQSFLYIKILIILISVFLTLSLFKKTNYILFLPLGYLFLHVLRERTDLRPEIFSFLFTALTLCILERYSNFQKSKSIYFLPLIQLLWINLHIYFFLGLLIQLIYLFSFYLQKERIAFKVILKVFALSFAACFINPNGINGVLYPLMIFNNYGYPIAENQSMFVLETMGFTDFNFLFVKAGSLVVILSLIVSFLRKPLVPKDILIPLLGLLISLINIRSFPYLFYLSFPFLFRSLNLSNLNKKSLSLIVLTAIILIVESIGYLNGNYYKDRELPVSSGLVLEEDGKKALDFVTSYNLPQPIYNNFDIGSYIAYQGYPKYRVFVDGRPEAYPADFFENVYLPSQKDYSKFKNLEKIYNFQTVIFSITDQTPWGQNFLKNITSDPDYATVYLDDFMIVLIKRNLLKNLNIAEIDLKSFDFISDNYFSYLRISYFLYNLGYKEEAKIFAQKSLELYPESKKALNLK